MVSQRVRCGLPHHLQGKKCPEFNSEFRKCEKIGHWDRVCKSRSVRLLHDRSRNSSDCEGEEIYFLGSVGSMQKRSFKSKHFDSLSIVEFGKVEKVPVTF